LRRRSNGVGAEISKPEFRHAHIQEPIEDLRIARTEPRRLLCIRLRPFQMTKDDFGKRVEQRAGVRVDCEAGVGGADRLGRTVSAAR
jgi:hypothetical protein